MEWLNKCIKSTNFKGLILTYSKKDLSNYISVVLDRLKMKLVNWTSLYSPTGVTRCTLSVRCKMPQDEKQQTCKSAFFPPHRNLAFCRFDQELLSRARTELPVFLWNSASRQSSSCVEAELTTPSTALSSPTSVTTSSPLPGQSTPVHPQQNSVSITPWRT